MIVVDRDHKISISKLKKMSSRMYDELVKAVIDIEQNIMVVDAEMHADQEAFLLNQGSRQMNLWGINLYPNNSDNKFIEFDSMINIRPWQNNRSRGIDNPEIQKKIVEIVSLLVKK